MRSSAVTDWTQPVRRGLVAGLAALALAGLAACTSDDHSLPSLGGSQASQANDLVAIAKSFSDCLTDAGIEVDLQANGEGEQTIVYISGDSVMFRYADGSGGASTAVELTPAQQELQDEFFSSPSADPALIVDGVDRSEAFIACLDKSGYDPQKAYGEQSYQMDPEAVARQVEANNTWAACARENGYPNLKDSIMPTDMSSYEFWPNLTLPGDITADALRQLLAACPTFDRDAMEAYDQWYQDNPTGDNPPDYPANPSINIDFPQLDWENETPSPEQLAAQEAQAKLYDILYGAQTAYYEEKDAISGG